MVFEKKTSLPSRLKAGTRNSVFEYILATTRLLN